MRFPTAAQNAGIAQINASVSPEKALRGAGGNKPEKKFKKIRKKAKKGIDKGGESVLY